MNISVVIPACNSSRYIHATLGSVPEQTVQPDEILLLDNGSIDDTISIVETYKPHITVFQQLYKEVAAARNVLCGGEQGELVALLDQDDILGDSLPMLRLLWWPTE